MVGARSLARPRSSGSDISFCAWSTHGNDASIVAAVSRTPGRISRAKARVGGKARLSEASAALAFSSVGASRRIEALRLLDSLANAAIVVLKFVIRSLSWPSLRISAPVVFAVPVEQARDVAVGLGAEQRLVDLGGALERAGRVLVGVVEGLGGGLPARGACRRRGRRPRSAWS